MPEVFSAKTKKTKKTEKKAPVHKTVEHSSGHKHIPHKHVDEYSETLKYEPTCTNPFAAFAPKPLHAHFQSQAPNEHIVLALRKHPITNVPWILVAIGMFFFPFIISFLIPSVYQFPPVFQFMTVIAWYLLVGAFVIESFLSWFFDLNLITDERIIDIDFDNLLYKRVSSAKIENIEDVTSSTGGFIRSMLSFGTVTIQTAGEKREFEFTDVPQPEKVVRILNDMMLEEEREKIEGRVN